MRATAFISSLLPAAVLSIALAGLAGPTARAQEGEAGDAEAPQILTTELARETRAPAAEMTVDFVFVDQDSVTEVTINGKPVDIEPGDTVLVTRTFSFTQDETLVVVKATDGVGNARVKSYVVYRPGFDPDERRLRYFATAQLRYELDDNPTNDLSTPVDLEGVEVEGVVPDDEQDDFRTTAQGTFGGTYGPWRAFAGAQLIRYNDADNEGRETDVLFLGGGYQTEAGFFFEYLFADLDLGGFDYAQEHTFKPGYALGDHDADEAWRHRFALHLTYKDFARDEQDDGTESAVSWEYTNRELAEGDTFRSVVALGTATEGLDVTEYTYLSGNFDWRLYWASPFQFDIGFGADYRRFDTDEPLSTETALGDKRVDNLWRFSFAPGWRFTDWLVGKFSYRYLVNISNKAPYVRQIYGLVAEGSF